VTIFCGNPLPSQYMNRPRNLVTKIWRDSLSNFQVLYQVCVNVIDETLPADAEKSTKNCANCCKTVGGHLRKRRSKSRCKLTNNNGE